MLQSEGLKRLVPYGGSDYSGGVAHIESRGYDVFRGETIRTTVLNRPSRLTVDTTNVPDSSTDAVTWTRNGLLLRKQTAQGLNYSYHYDHLRRLIGEVDPRIGNTEIAYYPSGNAGASGQIQYRKDPSGNQTTYTYQSTTGRLAWTTDPLGKQTYYDYTLRGEVRREWGPATYPVEYEYNDFGDRTKMRTWRTASGTPTDISWGSLAYPSASGDVTTWNVDSATGAVLSKTDAAGRSVAYTYTPRGNIQTRTWARGTVTTYNYSTVTGEQLGIDYSDTTPDLTYSYNRLGQTATVGDTTGTRTFSYSPTTTALVQEDLGAYVGSLSIARTYDGLGRSAAVYLGPTSAPTSSYGVGYAYDGNGRLNAVGSIGYTYVANSNLIASVYDVHSGWTQTRAYLGNRDLLDVIETKYSTASMARFDYAHDNLGRRTNVSQSGAVFERFVGTGSVRKWTYNDRSEVTDEKHYFGLDPSLVTTLIPGRGSSFDYDHIGNRQSTVENGSTASYSTNSLNQYSSRAVPGTISVTGMAPSAATITVNGDGSGVSRVGDWYAKNFTVSNGSSSVWQSLTVASSYGGSKTVSRFVSVSPESFTYDLDGNLTSDGRWDYVYDAENRLVSMQTRSAVLGPIPNAEARRIEFTYDYLGRRVRKIVRGGYNGSAYTSVVSDLKFIYDGWNLLREYNGSTLAVLRTYTWGLDWSGSLQGAGGVGGLLRVDDAATGASMAPAYDGNGNLVGLINRTNGTVAAAYEYDAFGQELRASGSFATENPFRFSTKYTDSESGLVYYGLRYYSPSLGRFVNRDPIDERGGLNLYAFCSNSAVGKWDYLGMLEGDDNIENDGGVSRDPNSGYVRRQGGGIIVTKVGDFFNGNMRGVQAIEKDSGVDFVSSAIDFRPNDSYLILIENKDGSRDLYDRATGSLVGSAAANETMSIESGGSSFAISEATRAPNNAGDVVASTSLFIGQQIGDAGSVRQNYINTVASLDPADTAGRTAAKIAARADTPPLVGGVIQGVRPGTGPNPGSVGRSNVTNSAANSLGQTMRIGGRVLVVGGLTYDIITIATSNNPARTTVGVVGGWAGAYGGGVLGAAGGTAVAPGPGTIVGGVGGAAAGGYAGQQGALLFYDSVRAGILPTGSGPIFLPWFGKGP